MLRKILKRLAPGNSSASAEYLDQVTKWSYDIVISQTQKILTHAKYAGCCPSCAGISHDGISRFE
jgi:hypothetical protein